MITLVNPWTGRTVDINENDVSQAQLDSIVMLMDDNLREQIHRELAPCSPGEFFARYVELVGPEEGGRLWFS